ncbi:50S ribosomal protein L4 [Candidatus Woesearchaeota archaeon]|nr:50S ribosomal protein L4 [Candidatus Woesearchaeota archaeon]
MKVDVFSLEGTKTKSIDVPEQFSEEYRPDLIRRVFLAFMSHNRQPYGAFPEAGKRQVVNIPKRRRALKTSYGHGIARTPRKIVWHRGRQFGWVGAFSPNTPGGRRAHPPKPWKIYDLKINIKERRKAIRSALAATLDQEVVKERGHEFKHLVSVVDAKIETLQKTKDVVQALHALKLETELTRVGERKIRAGKGKRRGRRYKSKKGPLLVVSESCPLQKAAASIPGIEICEVNKLNINALAPGGDAGRFTIFSEKAMEKIKQEQLFMNTRTVAQKAAPKKEAPKVKTVEKKTKQ